MARFNESGIPSEFFLLLRKLEAEIHDNEHFATTEKQVIKGYEKEITYKTQAVNLQQGANAELVTSISHLTAVLDNQGNQKESAREAGKLMKEQVKTKQNMFEIVKEQYQQMRNNCIAVYDEYALKLDQRLRNYEKMPRVAEHNHLVKVSTNLNMVLDVIQEQEERLQQKVSTQKDQLILDIMSVEEWGIQVAKLYSCANLVNKDFSHQLMKIKILREEVKRLEAEKHEKVQNAITRPHHEICKTSLAKQKYPGLWGNSFKSKKVPSFKLFLRSGFFPGRNPSTGTSGCALQGILISSNNLPNCSSLHKELTSKKVKPAKLALENYKNEERKMDVENTFQKVSRGSIRSLEVPLLRKMQERILQQKIRLDNEVKSSYPTYEAMECFHALSTTPESSGESHSEITLTPKETKTQEQYEEAQASEDLTSENQGEIKVGENEAFAADTKKISDISGDLQFACHRDESFISPVSNTRSAEMPSTDYFFAIPLAPPCSSSKYDANTLITNVNSDSVFPVQDGSTIKAGEALSAINSSSLHTIGTKSPKVSFNIDSIVKSCDSSTDESFNFGQDFSCNQLTNNQNNNSFSSLFCFNK
ncbi:uncharacterized protein LOC143445868 isoform X2 [Clavelina lepadiformis]|uniref:uncharacterized protein LOC143445868 isoform X2 n=1 Tax=Clavelina lepadiformis TaxID=159417 RepID=UPI00404276A3